MKFPTAVFIISLLLISACNSPKPLQIKDVCAEPEGTNAILEGYLSLPKTIDTIQLRRGERIMNVGYQLFLMTNADATGDAVKVTIWKTYKSEPNRIRAFSNGHSLDDLLAYTDDGKEIGAGKLLKISGETVSDEKTGCSVSVTKIELP